jgi:hypothetical protein
MQIHGTQAWFPSRLSSVTLAFVSVFICIWFHNITATHSFTCSNSNLKVLSASPWYFPRQSAPLRLKKAIAMGERAAHSSGKGASKGYACHTLCIRVFESYKKERTPRDPRVLQGEAGFNYSLSMETDSHPPLSARTTLSSSSKRKKETKISQSPASRTVRASTPEELPCSSSSTRQHRHELKSWYSNTQIPKTGTKSTFSSSCLDLPTCQRPHQVCFTTPRHAMQQ